MATLLRLTNKAGRFMALCMILAITASCTDEEVMNGGYAETDVLSFDVSISNEWKTPPGTRSAADAQAWHASRFDDSELWLIASSEQNMDTTLFSTPKTRAAEVTTNAFHESFGVYGYTYNGENWESRSNVKPYFEAEKASKNGNGLWTTEQLRYWPGASYRMHFFAYAPYGMATLSVNNNIPELYYTVPDKVGKVGKVDEVDKVQKDLVVATADVKGNHNQSVQLKFKHILTAVKIKAAKGIKITSVKLINIYGSGSYTFGENLWTLDGEKKDFNLTLDPDAEDGTSIDDEENTFMMIPQTLKDAQLEVTIDGKTLICNLSGKTDWEIGHTVIYRISKTGNYEFTVTDQSTFSGEGGSNTIKISSFKTENNTKTTVPWEIDGYYSKDADGKYTLLSTEPDWLVFPTYPEVQYPEDQYPEDQTKYNVKVYSQAGEGDNKTGENSGNKVEVDPNELLKTEPQEGTEAEPKNLAEDSDTTANCYIVNAPGWYKFPIVYGNALKKDGNSNTDAYNGSCFVNHLDQPITDPWLKDNTGITINSAELLWQDSPEETPLIDKKSVLVYDNYKYIKFYIAPENIKQGNAVIAVKDNNGDIAWSWHIWVTMHKLNDSFQFKGYRYFNALLGYREKGYVKYPDRDVYVKLIQYESGKSVFVHISQKYLYHSLQDGDAPYYQHGRKDPFPGASLEVVLNTNNQYSINISADKLVAFNVEPVKDSSSLGYAIQNPNLYIGHSTDNTNENWYWYIGKGFGFISDNGENKETGYHNLWGYENNKKTVYDPCPAGYKVPIFEAFNAVKTAAKTNDYVKYDPGIYIINNKNTENEQRFFLQILGSRAPETSDIKIDPLASLYCNRNNGNGFYLRLTSTNITTSDATCCAGRCILPQKE